MTSARRLSRIAIRREEKNVWERRTPLVPTDVAALVGGGLSVSVQPSPVRAFADELYARAGATLDEGLADCPIIVGLKELPTSLLRPRHVYVFFAHVIKGQHHNMPMLRRMLELGCTLIDYEKIVDDSGRRLLAFGRFAGQAGMIDTLWALGRRLEAEGLSTGFLRLRQAYQYGSAAEARAALLELGRELQGGLPAPIGPLVFAFFGSGNCSKGAQELFDLLPHRVVRPRDLEALPDASRDGELVKVVFRREDRYERVGGGPFDPGEYAAHPERYRGAFERYARHVTVVVNCVYWEPRYPRLLTLELLGRLYGGASAPRLKVIGDITCDLGGSIECTLEETSPGSPVYVYDVRRQRTVVGVSGEGPVVMAVDNLPAELPLESSAHFSANLAPYVLPIAAADFSAPFEQLALPAPVKRAVICHQGALAPGYRYLAPIVEEAGR